MAIKPEYVDVMKDFGGKGLHKDLKPLRVRSQRFEQTMDRIDNAVEMGMTHKKVLKTFSKHLLPHPGKEEPAKGTPAPTAAPAKKAAAPKAGGSKDKAAIAAEFLGKMSAQGTQAIAKAAHAAHPDISVANFYYLINKARKR